MGSKSDVSAFFRLRFRNGLDGKPAGALPFRMRSRRSFLRLCLVAAVSLCLVAEVSQWLEHDSIVFRGSKSNVSRFLRLHFRNGLDAKPAGALPFRMRSGRSFLRLCLVAEVSQWLGHDSIVFRGSKRNVSRFLRLQFRNGLDAKPAGALPFRMRSGRSFLRLCLVADVSQLLGHDSIVFRGSKSNVSRFLRLQFRNGLDAKPAGALPCRMRSGRSFLRLCLVAEVSEWLGHDFIVFRGSKSNVSRFLRLQFRNGLDAKPAGALPFRMRSGRSFLRLLPGTGVRSGEPLSTLLTPGIPLRPKSSTRYSLVCSLKWLAVDATTTGTGVPLGEGPSTLLTSRYFRAGVPVLFFRTIATLWLFFGASVIAETRKRKYTESNNRIGDTRLPQNQMQGHHPIALLFSPSPPLSGVGGMGGSP